MRVGFLWRSAAASLLMASCAQLSRPESQVALAASSYATSHSAIKQVTTDQQMIEGNYARVRVSPADGSGADRAWVFLKKKGEDWRVLTMGTGFTARDYRKLGIPKKLWAQ